MKSLLLATASLLGLTFSAPVNPVAAPWEALLTPPPAGISFFQLQTKSTDTTINNQFLTLFPGSTSYTLTPNSTSAAKFFTQKYDKTGTYAFHNSDDTRQVVLKGSKSSLLYLLDATNPSEDTILKGQLMEWATFTVDGSVLGNKIFVGVKGGNGGVTVALYDGVSGVDVSWSKVTVGIVKV